MTGERFSVRMKGGVVRDPETGKYLITIRVWDNERAEGAPEKEFVHAAEFNTEEAAATYYRENIRPMMDNLEHALIDEMPPGGRLVRHVGDL